MDCTWTDAPAEVLAPMLQELWSELATEHSFSIWYGWAPPRERPDMAFSVEADVYVATYVIYTDPADDARHAEWVHRRGSMAGGKPGTPAEAALRYGYGHVAFDVTDLDAAYDRAVARGARPVMAPCPSPEPGVQMASSPTRRATWSSCCTGPAKAQGQALGMESPGALLLARVHTAGRSGAARPRGSWPAAVRRPLPRSQPVISRYA